MVRKILRISLVLAFAWTGCCAIASPANSPFSTTSPDEVNHVTITTDPSQTVLTESSNKVIHVTTTSDTSTIQDYNHCGFYTCTAGQYCCKRFRFSSGSCRNYQNYNDYTCIYIPHSKLGVSTTTSSDLNCGNTKCTSFQYCCKRYINSDSYCYSNKPNYYYSCKYIPQYETSSTTAVTTTQTSDYNCGPFGKCVEGQYCCQKYILSQATCQWTYRSWYYSCKRMNKPEITTSSSYIVTTSWDSNCNCGSRWDYCCKTYRYSMPTCHSYLPYTYYDCIYLRQSETPGQNSHLSLEAIIAFSVVVPMFLCIISCMCYCAKKKSNPGRVISQTQQQAQTTAARQQAAPRNSNQQSSQHIQLSNIYIPSAGDAYAPQQFRGFKNPTYSLDPPSYSEAMQYASTVNPAETPVASFPTAPPYQPNPSCAPEPGFHSEPSCLSEPSSLAETGFHPEPSCPPAPEATVL